MFTHTNMLQGFPYLGKPWRVFIHISYQVLLSKTAFYIWTNKTHSSQLPSVTLKTLLTRQAGSDFVPNRRNQGRLFFFFFFTRRSENGKLVDRGRYLLNVTKHIHCDSDKRKVTGYVREFEIHFHTPKKRKALCCMSKIICVYWIILYEIDYSIFVFYKHKYKALRWLCSKYHTVLSMVLNCKVVFLIF